MWRSVVRLGGVFDLCSSCTSCQFYCFIENTSSSSGDLWSTRKSSVCEEKRTQHTRTKVCVDVFCFITHAAAAVVVVER